MAGRRSAWRPTSPCWGSWARSGTPSSCANRPRSWTGSPARSAPGSRHRREAADVLSPFELCEPTSVAEASQLLARHGDAARLYAGGTELLLVMKEGLVQYDYLVNVKTIPGLAGIRLDTDGTLRIGATTPHRALE